MLTRNSVMGNEVVIISIGGKEQRVTTVHKGLLLRDAPALCANITASDGPVSYLQLPDDDFTAIKLFMECIYSRSVPGVTASMDHATRGLRMKELARLYCFCEKHHVNFQVRNKVMDAIQDGFRLLGRAPPPVFVEEIYKNTSPTSVRVTIKATFRIVNLDVFIIYIC
jgi:hypothetical protein